ncbi:MAG: phosphoheptose isomerase [Actinomycetota bacterium]
MTGEEDSDERVIEYPKCTSRPNVGLKRMAATNSRVVNDYIETLNRVLRGPEIALVEKYTQVFLQAWNTGKRIYLCGNGGSAGNAIHLANDFTYGAGVKRGIGLRIEALPANASVLTCLANDIGYDKVFSEQLRVKAEAGDVLVVLSGSGNSPNVVKALEMGNELGMVTLAIVAYEGGRCKELAQHPMHFPIHDMQVAEDLQLIVGHMIMRQLYDLG